MNWYMADREQYHLEAVKFNEPLISYRHNAHGYRGDEFTATAKHRILVCGCSYAYGLAVNEEDTFYAEMKRHLGDDCVVWNFGSPGKSNEYINRMVNLAMNVLKPTVCLINFTYTGRRELFNHEGNYVHYLRQSKDLSRYRDIIEIQDKLSNGFADLANFYTCYKSIKNCMLANKTPWLFSWNENSILEIPEVRDDPARVEFFNKVDIARDNMHPGPKSHKKLGQLYVKKYHDLYGKYL
jgi:hypothetical protein